MRLPDVKKLGEAAAEGFITQVKNARKKKKKHFEDIISFHMMPGFITNFPINLTKDLFFTESLVRQDRPLV